MSRWDYESRVGKQCVRLSGCVGAGTETAAQWATESVSNPECEPTVTTAYIHGLLYARSDCRERVVEKRYNFVEFETSTYWWLRRRFLCSSVKGRAKRLSVSGGGVSPASNFLFRQVCTVFVEGVFLDTGQGL